MGRLLRRKRVTEPPLDDSILGRAPERFNFARDVVEAFAADPHRPALTFVDRIGVVERMTFKELAAEASRWAELLRSRGLAPGDRLLVLLAGTPAWPAVLLGALKAGLVPVPCPASVRARDVQFRVEQTGARLVVTDRAHAPMLSESGVPAGLVVAEDVATELRGLPVDAPTRDTASSEIALILYPSGATGPVKGATHTHGSTWAARLQAQYWLDARPDDLVWCTAETGSAKAIWNGLLGPWSQGAEIVIHEGGFEPEPCIELVRRLGVTVLCQTPAEYRLLSEHPSIGYGALGRLRHAVSAGGPLDPHALEVFRDALGVTVHEGYWQTESTVLVANMPGRQLKPGSMGLPLPGHAVAVIDDEGREQAPGIEGDIAVRGRPASLFLGYWNAPDETDAVFRGPWYVTGDRATRDDEGHFWFAGRADDVVLDAAHRIEPFTVESALLEHPAVAQSAVIGRPSAAGGEIVTAFVVLRPGAQPSDELVLALQDRVKAVTASSGVAREIEFVPALPMTASGKIRTDELREREPIPGGVRPVDVAASAAAAAPGPAEQPQEAEQRAGKGPEKAAAEEARRAAAAETREDERQRKQDAEQAHRDEAEARRAAEAKAKEDDRQHRQDEKRRNEEAKAAAEQAQRDEAEARRAAKAKAKEDEAKAKEDDRQHRQDEKRRNEEAKAAAEQAQRDEAEARRAAKAKAKEDEAKAKEDERQRKQDEKRRHEEAKAAAEQARRDEADARRAAEAKAKEDERQRKLDEKRVHEEAKAAAEQGRRAGKAHEPDESANPLLVSRLRAYGRRQDSEDRDPPAE